MDRAWIQSETAVQYSPPHPSLSPQVGRGGRNGETGTRSYWADWLRRGVAMGIQPAAFWRLSWREWRMLQGEAAPAMGRAALDALMEQFPDGA